MKCAMRCCQYQPRPSRISDNFTVEIYIRSSYWTICRHHSSAGNTCNVQLQSRYHSADTKKNLQCRYRDRELFSNLQRVTSRNSHNAPWSCIFCYHLYDLHANMCTEISKFWIFFHNCEIHTYIDMYKYIVAVQLKY